MIKLENKFLLKQKLFLSFNTDNSLIFVIQRERDLQVELHLAPKRG